MDFLQECTRRRESQSHGVVVYEHFSSLLTRSLRTTPHSSNVLGAGPQEGTPKCKTGPLLSLVTLPAFVLSPRFLFLTLV